ncbi:hypothetical protein BGZ94_005376, partial [Podila epigama]
FNETLRSRDPSLGVRDMEAVAKVGSEEAGLRFVEAIDMPSNNNLLIFEKEATPLPKEL